MALAKLGPVVQTASGAVGGVEFVNTAAGLVLRARQRKNRRTSSAALLARNSLAQAIAGWSALTDPQKTAWNAVAQRVSHTNRLGLHRPWSGRELYLHQNAGQLTRGSGVINTPLIWSVRNQLQSYTVAFTAANYNLTWVCFGPGQAGAIHVYAARAWSTTGFNTVNYRYIKGVGILVSGTNDLKPQFTAALGTLVAGEMFRLRLNFHRAWGPISNPIFVTGNRA